jgi:hypothetical protein
MPEKNKNKNDAEKQHFPLFIKYLEPLQFATQL